MNKRKQGKEVLKRKVSSYYRIGINVADSHRQHGRTQTDKCGISDYSKKRRSVKEFFYF